MITEILSALWNWRRRDLIVTLALSLASVAAEASLLMLLLLLLKRLGLPTAGAVPQGLESLLPNWYATLSAFVIGSIGQGSLSRANTLRQQRLGYEFGEHLTAQLLEGFSAMSFARLRGLESAEVTHLLAEDAAEARRAALSLIGVISQALLCLVYVAGTVVIAPFAAIAVLVLGIPLFLASRGGGWMKDSMSLRNAGEQVTESASDFALNIRTVRTHEVSAAANLRVRKATRRATNSMRDFQQRLSQQGRNQQLMVVGFFGLFVALLECFGGGEVSRLLPMAVIYLRLAPRVQGLQQQRMILSASTGGVRAIARTLKETVVETTSAGRPAVMGDIDIHGLSFEYECGKPVLALEEVRLRQGRWTTVVGVSGSGKSTLLRLLTGLEKPTRGSIQIGETPLEFLDGHAWRSQLSHVEQTSSFFHGSIRENLVSFAKADSAQADRELPGVLEVCGLGPLLAKLPDGLATRIDERGSHFSSGQKQRLALARALLRSPQLLLLDEATNALDEPSEAILLAALRRHLPNTTIVAASHRSATIGFGDAVLRL